MSSEIFRDRTEGATARRLDLLRRRRDELITMPHAVRRVYVARSARIAASLVACIGGAALVIVAAVPGLTDALANVLPGQVPAVLSQILLGTWVLSLFTYAMARSRSEHRFIVAMSRCVLPGDDLDHDIERLSHEHPDAIAKGMTQRLEVRSAALPVIAAALVLPATVLYVLESLRDGGWAQEYEPRLAAQGVWLVASGAIGLAAGIVMTKRFARVPAVAPIAGAVAVALAVALPVAVVQLDAVPLWLLAPLLLALTIAVLVRRLRIERMRIDAVDPAAGSELFSLRRVLADARRWARDRIAMRHVVGAMAAAALLVIAGGPLSLGPAPAATPARATAAVPPVPGIAALATSPIEPLDTDIARPEAIVTADIHAGEPAELTDLAGLATLPDGWKLTAVVRLLSSPGPTHVSAIGLGSMRETGASTRILEVSSCGGSVPLGLRVEPEGTWSGRVTIGITPTIVYAPCR